jgi:anti-anti-sigma regulatory factor
MSVRLDGNIIVLEGACRVEDAEPLLGWLQADKDIVVDLTDAEHLHTAVLQVLMALRPALKGTPKDAFIRDWITPALSEADPVGMAPQEG